MTSWSASVRPLGLKSWLGKCDSWKRGGIGDKALARLPTHDKHTLACIHADQKLKYVDHMATVIQFISCGKERKTPSSTSRHIWRPKCGYTIWASTGNEDGLQKAEKGLKTRCCSSDNSVALLYEDLLAVLVALNSSPQSSVIVYGLPKNNPKVPNSFPCHILHTVFSPGLPFDVASKRESEFWPYRACPSLQCTKDALDDLKTGQMLQTTEGRVMSLFVFKLKFLYGTGNINVYVFPNAKCSNKKT